MTNLLLRKDMFDKVVILSDSKEAIQAVFWPNKWASKKWEHLCTNPKIIPDIPHKTSVSKFRLATEHNCLVNHLHKIGILPLPKCIFCNHSNEDYG